ncbi:MAG: tetratricopeptide repeat protein, partial [Desulfobacterales bacterium]|nr:tetratricopeptide repeat protein [Desulfobacterales bacterium]
LFRSHEKVDPPPLAAHPHKAGALIDRGGKAPDAMLKVGYTYLNLDDPPKAKYYFKEVIKSYPFSSAAEKAELKLKRIR